MLLLLALLSCSSQTAENSPVEVGEPPPSGSAQPGKAPGQPARKGHPGPQGGRNGPPGPPGPGQGSGPMGGGKTGTGQGGTGQSGAQLQDSSGFPGFHDWPAPPGAAITEMGGWSDAVRLSAEPGGGYRPQVAVGADGTLHAVYYERAEQGDLIRHRSLPEAGTWSEPVPLGFDENRNWGPDLVARDDGSLVLVFDYALPDFRSRGYLTTWTNGVWSEPEPLTPDGPVEVGSGHLADGVGANLAYVWIGKKMDPSSRFQARWKWFDGDKWSEEQAFSDGSADAWHTNVERRPDGSMLVGYDVGTGGSETTLYVAEGRDGSFSPPENLTATGKPGERPHFAFFTGADGVQTDWVTWFHKEAGKPQHIYVRSGGPGAWGPSVEPSAGFGGFHFDPEIAVNADGVVCLVWGWDAGSDAEMVYSLFEDNTWSSPRKLADINWGKPGLASLVAGDDGRFHVIWNQGVRGDNDVFYASLVVK